MPREKTPPPPSLPTSTTTTSFFNAHSLLASRAPTVLSSMGTFTRQTPTVRRQQHILTENEEEDNLNIYDGNLGVGVKDAKRKARELNQEAEALRKKMFVKKRKVEEERRQREGSSEEEEGRAGVGRKKVKKVKRVEIEESEEKNMAVEESAEKDVVMEEKRALDRGESGEGKPVGEQIQRNSGPGVGADGPAKKKKKNKNKKKRKEAE